MPFWQWYVHNTFNSFSVFYLKVMLPSELSHALGWENPNFCSLCLDLSGELCLCFFLDLSKNQHSSSKFVPIQCISFFQKWNNEHISWNPDKFCGISQISVPKNLLWKPDLLIYEMWVCNTHVRGALLPFINVCRCHMFCVCFRV